MERSYVSASAGDESTRPADVKSTGRLGEVRMTSAHCHDDDAVRMFSR
ncbi:hypothetical protein [Brevibacterium sp. RIT 803]|nr:hypothetical protein [Brevibacterium sp. RIT 803]MBM6591814.1 hypothetical protein [Brevibacterium sp. RIT 803]